MFPETVASGAPMVRFPILLENLSGILRFLKDPLRHGTLVSSMAFGLATVTGDIRIAGWSGTGLSRAGAGALGASETSLLNSR